MHVIRGPTILGVTQKYGSIIRKYLFNDWAKIYVQLRKRSNFTIIIS